jgi:DNA-binding response OmpR family regulator
MKRILVVDDDPAALTLLDIALKQNGYQPLLAQDGVEALDLLESQPVDLIISDVAMPRMNGYQLCQAVKTSPQWALIPFILVSGRGLASDIRFGKSLGPDDYLTKPYELADLLAVIEGRLQVARRLRASLGPSGLPDKSTPITTVTLGGRQLRLDHARQQAWLDDTEIPLTKKEARLLAALAGW